MGETVRFRPSSNKCANLKDLVNDPMMHKLRKFGTLEISKAYLACLKDCSGLLHYKPRNTNLWQYPLVVSSICYAPRKKKVSVGWSETVY